MKKKIIILLCVCVFLAIVLIWFQSNKKAEPIQSTVASISTVAEQTEKNLVNEPQNVGQVQPTNAVVAPKDSEHKTTLEAEKEAEIRKMLEAQNKPIEQWGRVVDQDGSPLSDVNVKSEIGHFVWPPQQYPNGISTKQEITTDANGQFHIRDNSGTGLYVTLQKVGYEQESLKGYALGYGGGSEGNPVIFKMWSTNIHEKLITAEKKFQIVPDGRPYMIDLTKGSIAESGEGDLKVWVKRPEQITYGKRYDWSCEVDAINGGLLQESDSSSSMYSAPLDGYVPSFQFEQKVGSGWGDTTGPQRFYVSLNNGQEYGRITIELYAYYNNQTPGLIRLSYAINPSGSRILR